MLISFTSTKVHSMLQLAQKGKPNNHVSLQSATLQYSYNLNVASNMVTVKMEWNIYEKNWIFHFSLQDISSNY